MSEKFRCDQCKYKKAHIVRAWGKKKYEDEYSINKCNVCGFETEEIFYLNIHKATKTSVVSQVFILFFFLEIVQSSWIAPVRGDVSKGPTADMEILSDLKTLPEVYDSTAPSLVSVIQLVTQRSP